MRKHCWWLLVASFAHGTAPHFPLLICWVWNEVKLKLRTIIGHNNALSGATKFFFWFYSSEFGTESDCLTSLIELRTVCCLWKWQMQRNEMIWIKSFLLRSDHGANAYRHSNINNSTMKKQWRQIWWRPSRSVLTVRTARTLHLSITKHRWEII